MCVIKDKASIVGIVIHLPILISMCILGGGYSQDKTRAHTHIDLHLRLWVCDELLVGEL